LSENRRNIKLVVSYEGTGYAGFQKQRDGLLTIQGVLEEGINKVTQETATVTGAGRTDSGVHAEGQVANFFTRSSIPVEKIQKALNSILPKDIIIKSAEEVNLDFHARYLAKSKTYAYRIHNDGLRPLFNRNFVYHYKHFLDFDRMREAAGLVLGKQDFRSFQATGSNLKTTVRTVYLCTLRKTGPEIRLEINADGFLYHMVRNIAGSLIMVGNGRLTINELKQILVKKDRTAAGPTAPACGLCLEEVIY
jgi:tRNA pseudouridine38-40 synthase